jgi:anti-sigma B factor antagonist
MADKAIADLLTLDIERTGDCAVVRCHGRLVAGVDGMFYANVRRLVPETKKIVLDLSDLTRMDSMGLGALVRLYVSARAAGCALELIHLGPQIRQLLGLTHLLSTFEVIGERGIKFL